MTKIKICSDLHLEHYYPCQSFNVGEGDILILAGDIINTKHLKTDGYLKELYLKFFDDCRKNYNEVLYVFGNHEYYGYNYEGAKKKILEHVPNNFHILENETYTVGNWSFIGFTLWTDFFNENPLQMWDCQQYMNDYKVIRIGPNFRKLRVEDTLSFNRDSRKYLQAQLETLTNNVFVISHHAPSLQSIPEKFRTSSCNGAYCNDLDNLIMANPQIKYFAHGHTHHTFDYMIGECRVLCNPYGYMGEYVNDTFNPNLTIEIND